MSVDIATSLAVPYPQSYWNADGVEVDYQDGDVLSFGVVLVPRMIAAPKYNFNVLAGVPAEVSTGKVDLYWRPSPWYIVLDHPGDLSVTGDLGRCLLTNPGENIGGVYPVVSVQRLCVLNGQIITDIAEAGGGFEITDLQLSLRNTVGLENDDSSH
jgi:hypothetical protein